MKTIIRLLTLVFLTGCSSIFGPDIEQWSKRPMEPVPENYAGLYAEVEACWEIKGNFEAVNWFVADKITINGIGRARATTNGDDITIARPWVDVPRTIKHEASHHVSGLGSIIHYDNGVGAICDGGA